MAEEKGRAALLGRIGRYGAQHPDQKAENENNERKAGLQDTPSRHSEARDLLLGEIAAKRSTMEVDDSEVVGNDMELAQSIVSQATWATKVAADQVVKEHGPAGDKVAARHAEVFKSVMTSEDDAAAAAEEAYLAATPEVDDLIAESPDDDYLDVEGTGEPEGPWFSWYDSSEDKVYAQNEDGIFQTDSSGNYASWGPGTKVYEEAVAAGQDDEYGEDDSYVV